MQITAKLKHYHNVCMCIWLNSRLHHRHTHSHIDCIYDLERILFLMLSLLYDEYIHKKRR
jgi:agmatine/peptidylarginine deiminase